MLKTILKQTWIWFLLVGSVLVAFGISQIDGLTVVSQQTTQIGTWTWTYYKIDVARYLQNLDYSLADSTIINIVPTTPTLPQAPNWANILTVLKWAFNTLFIFIFNCIIYSLNWVVLAPLKILIYPVNLFYALLGINTSSADYIQAVKMIYSFEIPLIPNL